MKKILFDVNGLEYASAKTVLEDIAKYNRFCHTKAKHMSGGDNLFLNFRNALIILFKNDLIYQTVKKYIVNDEELFMTFLFSDNFQKISDLKKLKRKK